MLFRSTQRKRTPPPYTSRKKWPPEQSPAVSRAAFTSHGARGETETSPWQSANRQSCGARALPKTSTSWQLPGVKPSGYGKSGAFLPSGQCHPHRLPCLALRGGKRTETAEGATYRPLHPNGYGFPGISERSSGGLRGWRGDWSISPTRRG